MRVAITGTNGQLGSALQRLLSREGSHEILSLNRPNGDITDRRKVLRAIGAFQPEIVLHPAAYTYVDNCETYPETAYRVNALGTQNVALACAANDATLVYVSTNCVFDGLKTEPYWEFDTPNPTSVYGRSKLAAEWYTQNLLNKFYIARVSWVFGVKPDMGRGNFVTRMLQLADERGSLAVVDDEISNPTYAPDIAAALLELSKTEAYGLYHLVNEGPASRFEFTQEILRLSGRTNTELKPIKLADFKRPTPPLYRSALKNFCAAELGIRLRPWQEALSEYLQEQDLIVTEQLS